MTRAEASTTAVHQPLHEQADRNRPLLGRVALVTGASRGIGAGIAKRLAADGARVMLTYATSADAAAAVLAEITAAGGDAATVHADSGRADDVIASVRHTLDRFGQLDILVNNAGIGGLDPLTQVPLERIEEMIAVNIRGTILATQEALQSLPAGGRIINIGSVNADRMPIPGGSIYSMTKAAVAGFTRGLARELGPRSITVNTVQPGPIDTDLNSAVGPKAPLMLNAMALDRFGLAAEVAALVAFLAGPDAAFITGTSITIDGGFAA